MIKIMNEVDFSLFDSNQFGDDWVVNVPKECIKGATMLSVEEYEKYKDNISVIKDWWWLRSPGDYEDSACRVYDDGGVYSAYSVSDADGSIRPALIFNLQNPKFEVEDKFEFGGYLFTIISNNLAICNDCIGKGAFRKDSMASDANVYERSDAKRIVDNWFNKAYAEYEG